MRIFPRARGLRRGALGLLLGALLGWTYGLLQRPERSGLPEVATPGPDPQAPSPLTTTAEPPAESTQDVTAPVRKATSRARAKVAKATDELTADPPSAAAGQD